MKHEKVITEWYEIDFNTSHRYLADKINEFLIDSPDLGDAWWDNNEELRDSDGDFSGIEIYNNEETKPMIEFICHKLDIKTSVIGEMNIKLVG